MHRCLSRSLSFWVLLFALTGFLSATERIIYYPDDDHFSHPDFPYVKMSLREAIVSFPILFPGENRLVIRAGVHPLTNTKIPDGLIIEGEGPASTILDGGCVYASSIFWGGSNNVTIRNCMLRNSGWGFDGSGSNNTIQNCIIMNISAYGVSSGDCSKFTIKNNTIVNCGVGILIHGQSCQVDIINNIVVGCYYAGAQGGGQTAYYCDCWSCGVGQMGRYYGIFEDLSTCLNADPKFVDPAHLDFHLRGNSPCQRSGMNGEDMGAYGGPYAIKEKNK